MKLKAFRTWKSHNSIMSTRIRYVNAYFFYVNISDFETLRRCACCVVGVVLPLCVDLVLRELISLFFSSESVYSIHLDER